jgi:hypothetical protein
MKAIFAVIILSFFYLSVSAQKSLTAQLRVLSGDTLLCLRDESKPVLINKSISYFNKETHSDYIGKYELTRYYSRDSSLVKLKKIYHDTLNRNENIQIFFYSVTDKYLIGELFFSINDSLDESISGHYVPPVQNRIIVVNRSESAAYVLNYIDTYIDTSLNIIDVEISLINAIILLDTNLAIKQKTVTEGEKVYRFLFIQSGLKKTRIRKSILYFVEQIIGKHSPRNRASN